MLPMWPAQWRGMGADTGLFQNPGGGGGAGCLAGWVSEETASGVTDVCVHTSNNPFACSNL